MTTARRVNAVCALLACLGAASALAAPATLPPAPNRWVTDTVGFLSGPARAALDARLEAYQARSGHQVLVWIGKSSGGVPIEDFAVRAFEAWKPGRKGIDDGAILFILADDRAARLEVGYGLEERVPDAVAARVVRETLIPRIQGGDRDGAVATSIDAVLAAIDGRSASASPAASPAQLVGATRPGTAPRPAPKVTLADKIIGGLIVVVFLVILVTNPSLAISLLCTIFSGGSGGGSSRGGGGFSGGGGRSGGGGASGHW
jgi:uncharacterized protein